MLVLVPTREDVLAIESIEDAFDLSTTTIMPRELSLVRVAAEEGLLLSTLHALDAAQDESIVEAAMTRVVATGSAASKDVDPAAQRQIGINFEGWITGAEEFVSKSAGSIATTSPPCTRFDP